jgi:tRNA(fMet)-specific endonuclease VapC
VGELYYGAERSAKPVKNRRLIEEFLITINIIHSDIDIMIKFGELKAYLENNNIFLPDADLLIAATTFIKAERLITGNAKHFERFSNLSIENWIE